ADLARFGCVRHGCIRSQTLCWVVRDVSTHECRAPRVARRASWGMPITPRAYTDVFLSPSRSIMVDVRKSEGKSFPALFCGQRGARSAPGALSVFPASTCYF